MAQETARTYKQSIAPIQRADLMDYFPHLDPRIEAKEDDGSFRGYIGYIRQRVFEAKLWGVFAKAKEETEQLIHDKPSTSYWGWLSSTEREKGEEKYRPWYCNAYMNNFRKILNNIIKEVKWVYWDDSEYDKRIQMLSGNAVKYRQGAAVSALLIGTQAVVEKINVVKKFKVADKVKERAGKFIYTNIGKHTINKPTGLIVKSLIAGSSKLKPNGFKFGLNPNAIDYMSNYVQEALFKVPEDTKFFNKDSSRAFAYVIAYGLMTASVREDRRYGINNTVDEDTIWTVANEYQKYTDGLFRAIDFVTDFYYPAALFKGANQAAINAYNSHLYEKSAEEVAQAKNENERHWIELEEKVKQCICGDIAHLTDEELVGLSELLKVELKVKQSMNDEIKR